MKRFISALVFCSLLLVLLSFLLFPPVGAKENPLLTLLNLPAPAPPNPLAIGFRDRDQKFYSKSNPPKDDAPLGDILDYWTQQSGADQKLHYRIEPTEAVAERIMREIAKNPRLVLNYTNIFKGNEKGIDLIKEIYDREGLGGVFNKEERLAIKDWLTFNSSYFSQDLARLAEGVADTAGYVANQDELLALARVDFDKARPIIDRINIDPIAKTSRVLATWALYRHALDSGSSIDADRHREELKKVVEDRTALPGMRDMALDALSSEKEWAGRDEWYYSLFADETLAELNVNGSVHTGLTTLVQMSPDEKYIEKMIELAKSDNPTVRSAAVRNLVTRLHTGGPEVVRALLPWLDDPNWATDSQGGRQTLIYKLTDYEMSESVPGLLAVLDEKAQRVPAGHMANAAANAVNAVSNSANAIANTTRSYANTNSARTSANRLPTHLPTEEYYPNRSSAVLALKKQKDARAISDLRRMVNESDGYERGMAVGALFASGGFSVLEQVAALETAAATVRAQMNAEEVGQSGPESSLNTNTWAVNGATLANARARRQATAGELNALLAEQLTQATEITDGLARAVVDRIEVLDDKDKSMAAALRRLILKWQNSAINLLLLSDLKRGIADADTIVRLLGQRKELREKMQAGITDARRGVPAAIGIGACLAEDKADYDVILDTGEPDARIALLGCARLIRAPLPVQKVAENLKSQNPLLVTAAERYLESEDSPEARAAVLARHPGEAKILGATSAFFAEGHENSTSEYLYALYQTLGNDLLYNGWYGSSNDGDLQAIGKRLREEVKKDKELLGVYSYDSNYVRIYKDRVVFSWDEDDSRYRERPLAKAEFDAIKSYIATTRAEDLPPFISCGGEYCEAKELIMLGRNGGRRVYMNGEPGEFFAGLDRQFAVLKRAPATLKYGMSSEIPGLEIVLASDELHAETVWKDGADLRIAASQTVVRKKVAKDIEDLEGEGPGTPDYEAIEAARTAMREKRRHEGFSWYKVAKDASPLMANQPPGVEFLPFMDGLGVPPGDEQWKARGPGFELRASSEGLFKLVGGKLAKIGTGEYKSPVVTPNGRWAVLSKAYPGIGRRIVRVDLATTREYPVEINGYGEWYASVYIP
ncbi:MAG TPA: hypothetical protein VNA17_05335, partial [Pyrinomonadaceae bacterium]|nr:hypothetical protein [Pyrinomonadaceae bacterium]